MDWTEITIYTKKEALEPLAAALSELGLKNICIQDPEDMIDFISENSEKWDMVEPELLNELKNESPYIKLYVENIPENNRIVQKIDEKVKDIAQYFDKDFFEDLKIETSLMDDQDWINNWKVHFKPFELGEKLAIVPSWETYANNEGRIVISLDPGSSFGSGMHETTRMCLCALEDYLIEGDEVIDVGSGSGILSVAAAKLGASKVLAYDIDPNAVKDTILTAKENQVEDIILASCADLMDERGVSADIIVGNLFSNIIVRLTDNAYSVLKHEGLLITSGIIEETLETVYEAYQKSGFELVETANIGQWYCVIGMKKTH